MAVEDAVAAALLVTISGTLTVLAVAAFWRYRNPSFVLLTAAFLVALTEGIVISLLVLGLLPGSNMPIFLVAGVPILVSPPAFPTPSSPGVRGGGAPGRSLPPAF